MPRLEVPENVAKLLSQNAAVAVGVSGGKDSVAHRADPLIQRAEAFLKAHSLPEWEAIFNTFKKL
jgi:hypothetical protein